MSIRRPTLGLLTVLVSGAFWAPPAQAAPPNAQLDGTYACSTGQSYEVYVSDHSLVGYIDGRGVAPRAFWFTSTLHLDVLDGPYAGDAITASFDSGITGPNQRPINPAGLTNTSTCTQSSTEEIEPGVLDEEAVAFFGIDAKYLGATVSGSEDASITVYITTKLIEHR